jgi:carbamoyltransferase
MKDELIIAAYGSHNATVAMFYKGNYTVIEVERWVSKKNAGLITYLPAAYPQVIFDEITDYLLSQTDRSDVDLYLTNYNDLNRLKPKFNYKAHKNFDHHEAHAATAFYQSPYERAVTFTYDGGGDAGFFNVYMADRQSGVTLLERFNQDLGFAYMILADHLEDIRRDPLNIGNLVYAGKLMGLCSYGNVREEWLPAFTEFYETFNYHGDSYIGGAEAAKDALPRLMQRLGVEGFNNKTRISGQFAWDLAATTQRVFEDQFYKFAQPYFDKYPDLPVTMAGGCALNVILNSRVLKDRNGKLFVPPNTSDCGVAVGGLLLYQKPENQVDLTYSGTPILDEHMFSSYIENNSFSIVEDVNVKGLAEFIKHGNIVGIINGNSEHGPRALGNRSIMCNPVGDMKDVLNDKVKDREWYRPFAPVVRLEDAPVYFDFPEGVQSRHMTYVATIREEYRDVIPAVTHEDGTGRIQTVTAQQNPFLYELLTEFSHISEEHGVLLNTSFNVNGKPILTRLSEALEILSKTKLDAVYYKNKLVFRRGEEEKFTKNIISENIQPLSDQTTVYLMTYEDASFDHNTTTHKIREVLATGQKNVVVVGTPDTLAILESEFGEAVQYFELTQNLLYYHEVMQETYFIGLTVKEFAPFVRMLWMKNIMYKNLCRTQNHMFVSLDEYASVAKSVNMVSNLAREDDKIVVDGGRYGGVFVEDTLSRYHNDATIPSIVPQFDMIWGNIDNIEWLSVNYEGQLLSFMRGAVSGTDKDFGLITFLKCADKFKVW